MFDFARKTAVALLLALGAAAGCASNVPTGASPCPCAGSNVCCSSGVCAADEASCGAATAALSAQVSGEWVGYVENFTFASGSDAVKLSLQAQSDGSLSGTVVIGQGTPPAAPTDPNTGWPPAGRSNASGGVGGSGGGPSLPSFNLYEGYAYEARHIRWEALRLRLGFLTTQPWTPWCELQTPVMTGDGFGCADTRNYHYTLDEGCVLDTVPPQSIDCSKTSLCSPGRPCWCTATGCTLYEDPTSPGDNTLDVSLQGDRGDGSASLRLGLGGDLNVRLLRQH